MATPTTKSRKGSAAANSNTAGGDQTQKRSNSQYGLYCAVTGVRVGSNPAMNTARAEKAGITVQDLQNGYVSTFAVEVINKKREQHPDWSLAEIVQDIRTSADITKFPEPHPVLLEMALAPVVKKTGQSAADAKAALFQKITGEAMPTKAPTAE